VSQFLTAIAELEPMAVFRVAPAYPRRLAESNTNGYAVLRLRLNADGTVAEALAIEASHPEFAASASEAAGQWLYTPTKAGTTLDDVRLEFRRN
ncbi:MAG: energy transducer TonB, partial [Myxococcota bacterium]